MKFRELYSKLGRAKSQVNNLSIPITINGNKNIELKIERDGIHFFEVEDKEEVEEPTRIEEIAKEQPKERIPAFGLPGLNADDLKDITSDD